MSNIAYITSDGALVRACGMLWSGIYDLRGIPIFDGDRVSVYLYELDEHRKGTVVFSVEDGHPNWLVRLDKPYKHEHHLAALHGIVSYETEYHYLDHDSCCVISPLHKCLEEVRIENTDSIGYNKNDPQRDAEESATELDKLLEKAKGEKNK